MPFLSHEAPPDCSLHWTLTAKKPPSGSWHMVFYTVIFFFFNMPTNHLQTGIIHALREEEEDKR